MLSLEGVIDPVLVSYVQRGYRAAGSRGAQCLVLQINTPGGMESSMREIVQAILNAPLPTLAYVTPRGARAASAGAVILLACHLTGMAPGTTMGAAHPVGNSGAKIEGPMNDKITNDMSALMRSLAEQRHRDAKWAEAAVRKSLSVNDTEALAQKLVDAVAKDLEGFLAQMDGRRVTMEGKPRTLAFTGAEREPVEMNFRERLFHLLAHPELAVILLSLGTLGLVFELQSPHGITGSLGAICLVLALISLSVLPFSAGGLALMVLGLGLLIAELYMGGHGAIAVIGVICLLLGSLMLFSPLEPFWHVSRVVVFTMTGLTAAFFALLIGLGLGAQRRAPATGSSAIIGARGAARTALDPEGIVNINGEEWTAVSAGGRIRKGDRVQVTAAYGIKLEV
ncbi:MAG: nodulation protein NfeD, partial [bacterium]